MPALVWIVKQKSVGTVYSVFSFGPSSFFCIALWLLILHIALCLVRRAFKDNCILRMALVCLSSHHGVLVLGCGTVCERHPGPGDSKVETYTPGALTFERCYIFSTQLCAVYPSPVTQEVRDGTIRGHIPRPNNCEQGGYFFTPPAARLTPRLGNHTGSILPRHNHIHHSGLYPSRDSQAILH